MNELKAKLYKCFEILDNNFFVDFKDNINKRIEFQKYGLFFSTIFGLTTGTFSLYLHGPYNSALADLGYEYANNNEFYKNETKAIEFNNIAINIINNIKDILPGNNIDLLEIYSTYFYLKNKYPDLTEEQLYNRVHEIKKDLFERNHNINRETLIEINNQLKDVINTPEVNIIH